MLRLTRQQREALGETLRDLANLAAGALVLGQLVDGHTPSWWVVVSGAVVWTAMVVFALALLESGGR